ncbi:cytosolic sulfotransferase 3 [Lates calcarifer]|uniref:Sulfotransferase n=1 Tax=Lates calcarifer TaxID=8187 RepID=A0A4W6G6P5_LATCA|nr:cytosolic sulfotransferase 3 [Lates calcarifer]
MRECREGLDFRITSGTEPTITVETVMQQGEKGRQILVWENYNRTIGEEKSSTNTAEKPAEISMSLTPDKMDLPPRPELFDFHGVSMTHYFTDNWENIQNFQARPDDILIATYPKAGTTWVSYILDLLYFGETSPERQTSIPIYERVPFLDIAFPSMDTGKDLVDKLPTSPRLIKTHFPVQFVPKSFWEQNCRIIYVARNAKDNMVSFFHFDRMNKVEPEAGDWNSYFQRFLEGKMVFGSWYDHVNNWWKKKETYSNLHYMFFEDMIEDTGREIDKLCNFLGLSKSAEDKKLITGGVQFDNMKKNSMANYSTFSAMDFKVSPFMRKGKVGDWKNHFTVAQNEEFDEDYKRKMKDPTLQFRTEL